MKVEIMLTENRPQDGGKSAVERRLAMGLENIETNPDQEIELEELEPDDVEDIDFDEEELR